MAPKPTLVVFGANGRVGSLVVGLALQRGHRVIAFVYGKSKLPRHEALTLIKGDVRNKADVRRALRDADVVLSALGSWGTKTRDILSSGMRTIVPVMEELGLTYIVSLTGADAVAESDQRGILNKLSRAFMGLVGGRVITDGEEHIRILQSSSLDWTIVRSPVMLGGKALPYRLESAVVPPYATIRRASVAEAMLDLADSHEYPRSLVSLRQARH
jgi:putative NADH-flavin reductase